MTRAQAYAEGIRIGRTWAEEDMREGRYVEPEALPKLDDAGRAEALGVLRGYRNTFFTSSPNARTRI